MTVETPDRGPEGARAPARRRLALALGTLAVAGWGAFTMPRELYRGDAAAIKIAAQHLVRTGRLGIPADPADMPHPGPAEDAQGSYFFKNRRTGEYFPRWGVASTLVSAVPVLAERLLTGAVSREPGAPAVVLFHDLFNVALSALIFVLLVRVAELHTRSRGVALLFALGCLHATFAANYLRAQSSEIVQVALFLGAYEGLVRHGRALDRGSDPAAQRRPALASSACLGALVLVKAYYAVLYLPALWHLGRRGRRAGFVPAAGALGALALLALSNFVSFGTPLELGLGVAKPLAATGAGFSPRYYLPALRDFLLSANRSLFVHFPPLLLALPGTRMFARRHPDELSLGLLFALCTFLVIGCFENYAGEWCYGPRYFLFLLPVLSLPMVEILVRAGLPRPAPTAAAAAMTVVLGASAYLQIVVASCPFFLAYDVRAGLAPLHLDEADRYFRTSHYAELDRDLVGLVRDGRPYYPLTVMARALPPDAARTLLPAVLRRIREGFFPNYLCDSASRLLLGEPPPPASGPRRAPGRPPVN